MEPESIENGSQSIVTHNDEYVNLPLLIKFSIFGNFCKYWYIIIKYYYPVVYYDRISMLKHLH